MESAAVPSAGHSLFYIFIFLFFFLFYVCISLFVIVNSPRGKLSLPLSLSLSLSTVITYLKETKSESPGEISQAEAYKIWNTLEQIWKTGQFAKKNES